MFSGSAGGSSSGIGVCWSPRQEPPHPKTLTSSTQSRHLLTRILQAMESANTGESYREAQLPSSFPPHRNLSASGSSGAVGLKPSLVTTPRGVLKNVSDNVQLGPGNSFQQSRGTCVASISQGRKVTGSLAEVITSAPEHEDTRRGLCDLGSHTQRNLRQETLPAYLNKSSVTTPPVHHGQKNDTQRKSVAKNRGSSSSNVCTAASHSDMLKHKYSHPDTTTPSPGGERTVAQEGRGRMRRGGVEVGEMGREELERLQTLLAEAEEVAMMLVYSDGTTQLRSADRKRQQTNDGKSKPQSICVAYPDSSGQAGPVLQYANISLTLLSEDGTIRNILESVMSRAKVIVYKGQDIISALLSTLHDITPNVWIKWCPMDVGLGAWLLDPDHVPTSFSELLARYGMQQSAPPPSRAGANCMLHDVALLGPLMVKIYQQLQSKSLLTVFLEMETKLIPILAAMTVQGLQINCSRLIQFGDTLKKKIARVEASAHKAAGRSFQINSTSQLREILFDELHLDENMKLSTTQVHHHKSTSESVLTLLSPLHPLPKAVLEYRHLCKVNATYITGLMPHIHQGVLKPLWLHTGTATGRLVACNPNIQAFPKHAVKLGVVEEQCVIGKEPVEVEINVREVVESRKGYTFLAADFKSIELRVLAHLSGDAQLLSAFSSSQNADIFITLASEWLGVEVSKVTTADRDRTKHVVYAVVYGVGKERLAEMIKVSPSIARELTNSFLGKFPAVQKYITETVAECRLKGYLQTVCERRRWFPQITSPLPHVKTHSERQAVNFPVQGSAADICKVAMIEVTNMLAELSPKSKLLVQIHDELLFEVPDDEIASISIQIKRVLEEVKSLPCKLKVPLEVRVTAGKTWASLTPILEQ